MGKKRIISVLMTMFAISIILPVNSIPSGQGQQLFFDDFTSSQLSPNWLSSGLFTLPTAAISGNITQSGSWISLTNPRISFPGVSANGLAALNISPLISSSTTNQFIYMAWRMIPFNLTQVGNNPGGTNAVRKSAVIIGLTLGPTNGIGFEMAESDNNIVGSQREPVGIWITNPMYPGTASKCYASQIVFMSPPANCTTTSPMMMYTNANSPLDLNTVHIFTMELNFNKVSSWAAFQVDSNGWYNVSQTACSCIDDPGGNYGSLFPTIQNFYCTNNCNGQLPNQSESTAVDWVLVDNYVPSSLPAGANPPFSPANSPLNIPPGNNPITNPFGGKSPGNIWQYYANSIGQGVPINSGNFLMSPFYFGGTVLFAITVVILVMAMMFVPGVKKITSPFIVSMILFFDTIANFTLGTLPIWEFAGILIFFMAVMAGTIPSTIGGRGGGSLQ